MATFKRPTGLDWQNNHFSSREVGLTHPDNPSYIKLSDSQTIEILTADGIGIVIDGNSRTVNIFADTVKFHTKDLAGLRWNNLSFNHRSTTYVEPTFITHRPDEASSIYDDIDSIID